MNIENIDYRDYIINEYQEYWTEEQDLYFYIK